MWATSSGMGPRCVSWMAKMSARTVEATSPALTAVQWDIFQVPTRSTPAMGALPPEERLDIGAISPRFGAFRLPIFNFGGGICFHILS